MAGTRCQADFWENFICTYFTSNICRTVAGDIEVRVQGERLFVG